MDYSGSVRGSREGSSGSKNSEGVRLPSPIGKEVPRGQCKYPLLGYGQVSLQKVCWQSRVNKAPPFLARGLKREATGNPNLGGRSWRGRNSGKQPHKVVYVF